MADLDAGGGTCKADGSCTKGYICDPGKNDCIKCWIVCTKRRDAVPGCNTYCPEVATAPTAIITGNSENPSEGLPPGLYSIFILLAACLAMLTLMILLMIFCYKRHHQKDVESSLSLMSNSESASVKTSSCTGHNNADCDVENPLLTGKESDDLGPCFRSSSEAFDEKESHSSQSYYRQNITQSSCSNLLGLKSEGSKPVSSPANDGDRKQARNSLSHSTQSLHPTKTLPNTNVVKTDSVKETVVNTDPVESGECDGVTEGSPGSEQDLNDVLTHEQHFTGPPTSEPKLDSSPSAMLQTKDSPIGQHSPKRSPATEQKFTSPSLYEQNLNISQPPKSSPCSEGNPKSSPSSEGNPKSSPSSERDPKSAAPSEGNRRSFPSSEGNLGSSPPFEDNSKSSPPHEGYPKSSSSHEVNPKSSPSSERYLRSSPSSDQQQKILEVVTMKPQVDDWSDTETDETIVKHQVGVNTNFSSPESSQIRESGMIGVHGQVPVLRGESFHSAFPNNNDVFRHSDDVREETLQMNSERALMIRRYRNPNRRTFDIIKKFPWVEGFSSEGQSIDVFVNYGRIQQLEALAELCHATGELPTKFKVKSHILV